ncbi:MAG TPA: TlpA disulfide reductase family protein [Chitinophagaceae bacterium]|nr:TlpA disulfide reductase family protein [Chitinophagaceae bacterium]
MIIRNYNMMYRQLWKLLIVFVFFFSCRQVSSQDIPKWKIEDLQDYITKSDTPVVVNFWATYCVPCIKEIPYFQEVIKKYEDSGVKLLLVSLDFKESYPDKISSFADKRKFDSPIVWLDETNADYFCPKIDSDWSGVMPATLFINNKNGHRSFFEEEMPREKFEDEIKKILDN